VSAVLDAQGTDSPCGRTAPTHPRQTAATNARTLSAITRKVMKNDPNTCGSLPVVGDADQSIGAVGGAG